MTASALHGKRILLSASVPDELRGTPRAQELFRALTVLSRAVATAGGHLAFGGHPTITPVMARAAQAVGVNDRFIHLYQGTHFRAEVPAEVSDTARFARLHWIEEGAEHRETNLTALRTAMARESHAAIFLGGRGAREECPLPGLREEYRLFREYQPGAPVYLLGLLDGEARRMIDEVERGELEGPNGLSPEERRLIHDDDLIELIVPLIVRDLTRWKFDPE